MEIIILIVYCYFIVKIFSDSLAYVKISANDCAVMCRKLFNTKIWNTLGVKYL